MFLVSSCCEEGVVDFQKVYWFSSDSYLVLDDELKQTMEKVVTFCLSHEIVDKKPEIGYGAVSAQLVFDPAYVEEVKSKN